MAFSTLILLRLPQRKGSPRRSRQFTDQAPLPSIDVCLIYIEHLKFPPWRFVSGLCNPSQLAHTSQSRTRTPYGMKVCMCRMETFKFPLLQQLIFPPHQTFHITTPLELDFGSVQGLVIHQRLKVGYPFVREKTYPNCDPILLMTLTMKYLQMPFGP